MFPAILNLKGVHDHKITIEISEIENISGDEINFDSLLTVKGLKIVIERSGC